MKKFKFKKDEIVSFTVDGEKHLGQIVSGGVCIDDYVLSVYYCVDDMKEEFMWCIFENELEKTNQQELVEKFNKAFSDALFGYNPFGAE